MHTSPPPAPPYGSLIEVARKGTRLSMQRAADLAGVSKATWIDNTRGYRKRGDRWEAVEPKPETVARMTHAVGLSPERLETEGQRPDAAMILREILRSEPAPPSRPAPVPPPADSGEPDDTAWRLFPASPEKRALWRLTDGDGRLLPERIRAELVAAFDQVAREMKEEEDDGERGRRAAG